MPVIAVSIVLLLSSTTLSRLINVTIDDEYGDEHTGLRPRYEPDESANWLMMSAKRYPGSFDYSQVHNATLHECFFQVAGNMTFTFNGTAIYVFFVLNALQDMDALFYLNGASQPSGNYTRLATAVVNGQDNHLYNQLTFKRDGLGYGNHSLSVLFSLTANEFFDYALYSTDDGRAPEESTTTASQVLRSPDPSAKPVPPAAVTPHPSSTLGPAVGGSLAGALLIIALGVWVVYRTRRRMLCAQNEAEDSAISSDRNTATASVIPFTAPTSEPMVSPTGTHNEKSDNPLKLTAEDARLPGESIALFRLRAELERVRAESERAHAENERVREEIELLRRVAVPPPYSDGGRGNAEGRA